LPPESWKYWSTTCCSVGTWSPWPVCAFHDWIRCAAAAMVQSPYWSLPSIGQLLTFVAQSTAAGGAGSGAFA
jgi:hypothetical protein